MALSLHVHTVTRRENGYTVVVSIQFPGINFDLPVEIGGADSIPTALEKTSETLRSLGGELYEAMETRGSLK